MKTLKITMFLISLFISVQIFSQTNVALNKSGTITQNGNSTTAIPSTVFDGVTTLPASNLFTFIGYQNVPYLLINLGAKYDLSYMKFYWGPVNYAKAYTFSVSSDGINWTPSISVTNNTNNTAAGDRRDFSTTQIGIQYIKLSSFTSSNTSAYYIDLYDLQAWGVTSVCATDGAFKKLTVCDVATFNSTSTFIGAITAGRITDINNSGYYLVPAGNSILANLSVLKITSKTNSDYYLDLANGSRGLSVMGDISTLNGDITTANGSVGIGTTNVSGARLTVKGKILASEVQIVDIGLIPADYVFKSDYKLMSLYDLEQYVRKNSHLPDVPSAQEMLTNGLNMSEMSNVLLKKVEELTLYTIDQAKQIQELKEIIERNGLR